MHSYLEKEHRKQNDMFREKVFGKEKSANFFRERLRGRDKKEFTNFSMLCFDNV